jgi:glyoxylase-like metal-dependent hydrolase (beta-lactamase superfamily II)
MRTVCMPEQIPLDEESRADQSKVDTDNDDGAHEVAADIAYKRLGIVNVVYYGQSGAGDRQWVLIDAGLFSTAGMIRRTAEKRFGENSRPAAIIMTHAHFDHAGALEHLVGEWDAPVYAHPFELSYLNGAESYPPPDPTVGGGMMAAVAGLYRRKPYDVKDHLQALPADGQVPHMPGWRWIHTPGHTTGHVSLWRERDRSLIAGDAFITTNQESATAVATQKPEMHGPPMYFTPDWESARRSVELLAALDPELVVTGHGRAMQGEQMRLALHALARNFNEVAVPEHGRYVPESVVA